jgi:DNA-binding XRE family transcriptional regulator
LLKLPLTAAKELRYYENLMSKKQQQLATKLGFNLRSARDAKQWTLETLQAEANVSIATISELENGKYLPTTNTLLRLASALGVSLHQLTGA